MGGVAGSLGMPSSPTVPWAPLGAQTIVASGFNLPNGVTVDSAGDVYVSDVNNNRVVKVAPNWDPDHRRVGVPPSLRRCGGLGR